MKDFVIFDYLVSTPSDFSASHPYISASIVESLHPRYCVVEDPIIVSNPIAGSAHLSLTCEDLRIAIFMLMFFGLWVGSKH